MAVEARHHELLLRPQLIQDRDLLNLMNQGGTAAYNSQQQQQQIHFHGFHELPENQAFYQSAVCDSVQAKTSVNTDSGLTYNIPVAPKKRSRDCFNQLYAAAAPNFPAHQILPAFSCEDMLPQIQQYQLEMNTIINQHVHEENSIMLPQIQQYQLEMNTIINQHTKKIRLELEERQKYQARLLAAAIGEGVMKKLKEKDEQIQRIGKLNFVLQEKVKSLYVENQLWRDLAQSNEATANYLRSNLERVLLHVNGGEDHISGGAAAAAEEEDAESCCGSSDHGVGDSEGAQDKDSGSSSCYSDRKCKICDEREACVLLLPCRHLCLCSGCGSQQLQACPVCNSSMNATLHVNMSP